MGRIFFMRSNLHLINRISIDKDFIKPPFFKCGSISIPEILREMNKFVLQCRVQRLGDILSIFKVFEEP